MKLIDEKLLNRVSTEAKKNSRLRKNYNLHQALNEPVQKLLNAMEPGTQIPIHRHKDKEETLIVLKGDIQICFYNDNKIPVEKIRLNPSDKNYGITIPAGVWHNLMVMEKGTVIFEVKEGPYAPISEDDILM